MGLEEFTLATGIVFLAYFVKGFSGFGSAIIAAPLLALFLSLQTAVSLLAILGLVANVLMAWVTWRHIDCRETALISEGLLPFPLVLTALALIPVMALSLNLGGF